MLKEQYDALLAAGMPEREGFEAVETEAGVRWTLHDGLEWSLITEIEACDLATMHALRWWRRLVTERVENDEMVIDDDTVAVGAISLGNCFDASFWADDILDVIVKAVTA